ncbi:MAG: RNA-binding protein [Deltaproteobacteria bacterium]|nr:MAG: RNA-binding protein [Deltaproteobacteria bacterium]
MKLYVGNLSYNLTDAELRDAFAAHGEVTSAEIVKDRASGQSKGFGFIEMPSEDEAKAAIQALHGTALKGRTLNVNEARPRADGGGGGRDRRGGPGGGRGGPGGGRGGYQ